MSDNVEKRFGTDKWLAMNNIQNPNVKNANKIHCNHNFVLVDKNYQEVCGPDPDHSLLP